MIITQKHKKGIAIAFAIMILCIAISIVDGIISPPYFVKSAIKVFLFALIPFVIMRIEICPLSDIFKSNRRASKISLCLGLTFFVLVIAVYFLLRGTIDFSGITESLSGGEGITKELFPFVAIYIALVNSFLEEFFFRFFSFHFLGKYTGKRFAFFFSATVFALYHVSILSGWFSPLLSFLLIAGLVASGIIFNLLDSNGGILPSWLLHMFANLAINSIGMILFYTN